MLEAALMILYVLFCSKCFFRVGLWYVLKCVIHYQTLGTSLLCVCVCGSVKVCVVCEAFYSQM